MGIADVVEKVIKCAIDLMPYTEVQRELRSKLHIVLKKQRDVIGAVLMFEYA
jgi:hypothetical protein